MDKVNLSSILRKYVLRFDEFNNGVAHDEGFKWRAVQCFHDNWNIDAEDFPAMFKASLKESDVLIDDNVKQPTGGIRLLFKHNESEFVRKCFRELFVDDKGDLNKRQGRAEAFKEKINHLIDKYAKGSWKYPQEVADVIGYLNLWQPGENFLYRSSRATAMAEFIDFDEDIGTGMTFSLEKYYRMCDLLLNEIKYNDEILELHTRRIKEKGINVEDRLHILVFDIIYCAHAYRLYEEIAFSKASLQKKNEIDRLTGELERLQMEYHEKECQLQTIMQNRNEQPPIVGETVTHKVFQTGIVVSCIDNILVVDFNNEVKRFQFPGTFASSHLSLSSPDLMEQMNKYTMQSSAMADIKNELESLEERIQDTENQLMQAAL